jgi:hypothetical protein
VEGDGPPTTAAPTTPKETTTKAPTTTTTKTTTTTATTTPAGPPLPKGTPPKVHKIKKQMERQANAVVGYLPVLLHFSKQTKSQKEVSCTCTQNSEISEKMSIEKFF